MMADNLFTVRQIAFILKVHPLTIRRYIKDSRLKAVKLGGNVRIKESDLNSFQSDLTQETKRQIKPKERSEKKVFSEDDPLWRLNGRIATIT